MSLSLSIGEDYSQVKPLPDFISLAFMERKITLITEIDARATIPDTSQIGTLLGYYLSC
jgi:hypothetical protein